MNQKRPLLLISTLILAIVLQGCAYLIGGAVVTSIVVAHDRRSLGAVMDDNIIEVKIRDQILIERPVRKQVQINITSVNGIVLLTGETPTTALRDQVLGYARSVPQVRQVINEIRIAGKTSLASRSNDGWVTGKVKSKLLVARGLGDAARINVHTAYGVVYLMGLVTRAEGKAAGNAARTVKGVTRVVKVFEYVD